MPSFAVSTDPQLPVFTWVVVVASDYGTEGREFESLRARLPRSRLAPAEGVGRSLRMLLARVD